MGLTYFLGLLHTGLSPLPVRPGLQGLPPSQFSCIPSSFWSTLFQILLLLTPGPPALKTALMVAGQQEFPGARHSKAGARLNLH